VRAAAVHGRAGLVKRPHKTITSWAAHNGLGASAAAAVVRERDVKEILKLIRKHTHKSAATRKTGRLSRLADPYTRAYTNRPPSSRINYDSSRGSPGP